VSDTIDLSEVAVPSSYTGARLVEDRVTLEFVQQLVADFKEGHVLHRRYALAILLQIKAQLQVLPTIVNVPIPAGTHITVCGDVHGQWYDLINIFTLNGMPSEENRYLFNGDFVDRGSFSVEVIFTLFALKCLYPTGVYLTRGNHETKAMNSLYGFEGEVRAKYNETMVKLFACVSRDLQAPRSPPFAHLLSQRGLSMPAARRGAGRKGLYRARGTVFARRRDAGGDSRDGPLPGTAGRGTSCAQADALLTSCRRRGSCVRCCGVILSRGWGVHPASGATMRSRPPASADRARGRGVGVAFGADVTKAFLQRNGLELLVRSHEVKEEGFEVMHDGCCITIISAPNYCDQMGNKGAFSACARRCLVLFSCRLQSALSQTWCPTSHPSITCRTRPCVPCGTLRRCCQ